VVAVRLGPFHSDGELPSQVAYQDVGGGKVDLDQWNPAFWGQLGNFVRSAGARGIYVEFDLIDAWTLKHDLSPWQRSRNSNGYDGGSCDAIAHDGLDARQRAWLEKIAQELGGQPNVLFQISNESDVCQGRLNPEWEIAVYNFMKARTGRPVGTNSRHPSVEGVVDYIETHECEVPFQRGKPAGTNEWNCRLSAADFCALQKDTGSSGWFLLWGDGMAEGEWEEALKCLK